MSKSHKNSIWRVNDEVSLSPRLGLLDVFFLILKKPFPKDERAFLEPKPSSSMVAGSVAEGPAGGFSPVLPASSLVF